MYYMVPEVLLIQLKKRKKEKKNPFDLLFLSFIFFLSKRLGYVW